MSHPTLHDKAALTAMLIKSLREILKEPKNFVRTVAICDNALEMVDSSFPQASSQRLNETDASLCESAGCRP
jgi:hypothetical protein